MTLLNWKLATTTFDTTNYGGKLLVFWVVVWGEDAEGKLIQEMEGHGLKGNSAKLTFKQISGVPFEDYSTTSASITPTHDSSSVRRLPSALRAPVQPMMSLRYIPVTSRSAQRRSAPPENAPI